MPKYQCEKCGALFAGWAGSKTCPKCGGRLRAISFEEYYKKNKKLNDAEKVKKHM